MYPYVGKYIKDLTLAQIKTMDCGYQQLPGFPEQEQVKGFRMVELQDVLGPGQALPRQPGHAEHRDEGGGRRAGADRAARAVRPPGLRGDPPPPASSDQVTIQSFDWGALTADAPARADAGRWSR